MPIDYATAYEISRSIRDWPFACVGFIPLVAGVAIIWCKRRFKFARPPWAVPILLCLFGGFWIAVFGFGIFLNNSATYTAYKNGDYQTIEGVVTDFNPMPYGGHQDECFSVQDQRFCYSDYDSEPGFNNAASHGGPIRVGLPVRIAYRDGRIMKLEVPRAELLTAAQASTISSQAERQSQKQAENDPVEQEMQTASLFTAVCWTLWWNLQWKRAMRFWLKPPYHPWFERGFRVFFALNFAASLVWLMRQIHSHPLSKGQIQPTIQIAAVMCTLVALMSAFTLWRAKRRDAKT